MQGPAAKLCSFSCFDCCMLSVKKKISEVCYYKRQFFNVLALNAKTFSVVRKSPYCQLANQSSCYCFASTP